MYTSNVNKKQKSGGLGYLLVGAGAAAWWLSKEGNRSKLDGLISQAKQKLSSSPSSNEPSPLQKAGDSHSIDVSDHKMVGEGPQFAVDYYNKKQK
ncbi:hypothetical protein L2D08_06725 [Domibacillus sp. PGB-M46]|uniref:hypothetical protein n=1 Tax=Domibacillus sp. PGB-M46 TaxID=2910255 RepID=UPI001F59A250|nr:hypothetical protein [Domibacillus sp. PGB-M46]MCI2254056.1 hypothetical protein [Domibacillus sp. PGB-M46]